MSPTKRCDGAGVTASFTTAGSGAGAGSSAGATAGVGIEITTQGCRALLHVLASFQVLRLNRLPLKSDASITPASWNLTEGSWKTISLSKKFVVGSM